MFLTFDAFSAVYSGRSRKMQKNGEIRAKIGVDTADILILWPSAKIKMKVQYFVLENLHPADLQSSSAVSTRVPGVPNAMYSQGGWKLASSRATG